MMNHRRHQNNQGFTLIEMIVSLGVFAIVVTTAVGALLMLITTNQQLQAEQTIMTNLAFALDTMTREMRTGSHYYCAEGGSNAIFSGSGHESLGTSTQPCPEGRSASSNLQGVSFYEGGNSLTGTSGDRRVLYFYDEDAGSIMRRIGDNDPQSIVSSGMIIQNAEFIVTGTDTLSSSANDTEQPTITVYIEAQEKDDETSKTYHLQTSVTQRILDL